MKKKLCAAIATLGVLWMVFLVGGTDLGLSSFADLVAQGTGAATSIYLSVKIGGLAR